MKEIDSSQQFLNSKTQSSTHGKNTSIQLQKLVDCVPRLSKLMAELQNIKLKNCLHTYSIVLPIEQNKIFILSINTKIHIKMN